MIDATSDPRHSIIRKAAFENLDAATDLRLAKARATLAQDGSNATNRAYAKVALATEAEQRRADAAKADWLALWAVTVGRNLGDDVSGDED